MVVRIDINYRMTASRINNLPKTKHWGAHSKFQVSLFLSIPWVSARFIENTLLYVQLVNSIFQEVDDEYVCKVARTAQEAVQLVELGFKYVTGEYSDGGKLFKKKKLYYSTPAQVASGL
jgi:hypothetical protein